MSAHKDPNSDTSRYIAYLLKRQGQWIDIESAAAELSVSAGLVRTVTHTMVDTMDEYTTFTKREGHNVTHIKVYDRHSETYKRSLVNVSSWPIPASLQPKFKSSRTAPVKTVFMRHEGDS